MWELPPTAGVLLKAVVSTAAHDFTDFEGNFQSSHKLEDLRKDLKALVDKAASGVAELVHVPCGLYKSRSGKGSYGAHGCMAAEAGALQSMDSSPARPLPHLELALLDLQTPRGTV